MCLFFNLLHTIYVNDLKCGHRLKKIASLLLSGIMLSCFYTQAVAEDTVTLNEVTFPSRLLDILKFIPEDSKTNVKPDVKVLLTGPFIDFLRALKSTDKFGQTFFIY